MSELIKKIFAPQLEFEGVDNSDKFVRFFCDLYRIELFKDGLDLILTKVQERDIKFEIKIIKGWDTYLGCYLTEQEQVFNKILGKFSTAMRKKIIIKSLACNVLAHEMAHALEVESGLNLGEEFRQCIGLDMKGRDPQMLPLKAEVKRLMVDALKAYKPHQFLSELFARYFELLSVSRNVKASGDFATSDVMDFFVNTTNFVEKIFNAKIRAKIDPKIAAHTLEIARQVKLSEPQNKFQDRVESFHKHSFGTTAGVASKSWSKNVKSNAMFQAGWQKHQELEDKKS